MESPFQVQLLTWNQTIKDILISVAIVAFLMLLPMYFLMYPAKDYPGEIQTAYYIGIIPKWVAQAFVIGCSGIVSFIILQKIFLKKVNGHLFFLKEKISFNSSRQNFDISYRSVKKILFVPKINLLTKKEKHRLTIYTKRREKFYFKLLDENEFELLFQTMLLHEDKIQLKAEPDEMMDVFD